MVAAGYNFLKRLPIRLRHAASGEPPLESRAHGAPVECGDAFDGIDRFSFVLDDKAGDPVLDDFRNGSAARGNDRVPHAIASIITSPNGSGQSIGKSTAMALPRKPTSSSVIQETTRSVPP
jgi:hypothetical protein